MNTIAITKEYNKLSSERHNMDIYDVYANDWGVLQYGVKYNEYTKMYDFYNITTRKNITGLTYEKCNRILNKEIEYQIELFKKHKRL